MSLGDFLKDLPTYNRENFTRINSGAPNSEPSNTNSSSNSNKNLSTSRHRPTMYVPTKDYPYAQEIVTETTSILLRYLHQQLDKKIAISAAQKKREAESPSSANSEVQRKKARLDPLPNGSNTVQNRFSMGSAGSSGSRGPNNDPNMPSTSSGSY